jgi:PAS domain S-box-containing protein
MARSGQTQGSGEATDNDRLRLSEARYRTLFEHAPEALVVVDADLGRFVEVNAKAEALFALHRSVLYQRNPASVSPPTQPDGRSSEESAREKIEQALNGETPRFEWIHQDSLGRDILCEVRLVRMPAEGQRLVRGSITDIRERRRLEEEVHQSRKMEAIGKLAGGIAHDFNNLLTVINSYAQLALVELDPRSELADQLRKIHKSGQRAASLTAQLLAFGRKQVIEPQVLDINRVVGDLLDMLRRVIGENIELVMEFGTGLRPIEIDPGQLEQIVINLVVNARDAMPKGGTLFITTRDAVAKSSAPGDADTTPFTVLEVSDTGSGIPPEIRERIFEPFFTTKHDVGTGLGLSTVYGVVEQNGGHIRVESAVGKGASFEVWLPATAKPALDVSAPSQEVACGRETILLAEDDEGVRELVVATLRGYGYTVLEAADANAALTIAGGSSRPIDMLITDVILPGMTGLELSERLTASRPETVVLLISGYTDDLIPPGTLRPGVSFMPKPFLPDLLASKVRQLLDDRRPASPIA